MLGDDRWLGYMFSAMSRSLPPATTPTPFLLLMYMDCRFLGMAVGGPNSAPTLGGMVAASLLLLLLLVGGCGGDADACGDEEAGFSSLHWRAMKAF